MGQKAESKFIQKIHRSLKRQLPSLYCWKINAASHNGIADCYYSDRGGDMWVEYKFIERLPKRDTSPVNFGLAPLQQLWLQNRARDGRVVALIIGSPLGVHIYADQFPFSETLGDFIRSALPFEAAVQYILDRTAPTDTATSVKELTSCPTESLPTPTAPTPGACPTSGKPASMRSGSPRKPLPAPLATSARARSAST